LLPVELVILSNILKQKQMKTIFKTSFALFFCLSAISVFGQKNKTGKPILFSGFARTIPVSSSTLEKTMSYKNGETVSIAFNEQLVFKGEVISNEMKYHNLQSVLIRSQNFENTLLQISRISEEASEARYVGRIINPDAADGYELKKDNQNNYSIEKFEISSLLQDCHSH
jgi:hypothetical protein